MSVWINKKQRRIKVTLFPVIKRKTFLLQVVWWYIRCRELTAAVGGLPFLRLRSHDCCLVVSKLGQREGTQISTVTILESIPNVNRIWFISSICAASHRSVRDQTPWLIFHFSNADPLPPSALEVILMSCWNILPYFFVMRHNLATSVWGCNSFGCRTITTF